jgi:hypothetical protein
MIVDLTCGKGSGVKRENLSQARCLVIEATIQLSRPPVPDTDPAGVPMAGSCALSPCFPGDNCTRCCQARRQRTTSHACLTERILDDRG